MRPPLHDEEARTRFVTGLDRNFCVSAGAGAGKTTAIVRRIAELAEREEEALGRLVVVTYTRSAAEELRVRSRKMLLERAGERAGELLGRFGEAFFGTIHSFCLKLVREHGAELGVSPDVELLEATDEAGVWARYCESPALDRAGLEPESLDEVMGFLSFEQLLQLGRKIQPEQAGRLLERAPEPRPELSFPRSLADAGGQSKENTRRNQDRLREFLQEHAEGAAYLKIPEFKQGSGTFLAAYQQEIEPFARWLDAQAARLAARIALGYRDYRRERRLMTYADQVAWCGRLLDEPRVLERLRARDWRVLLDEAQDTDGAMFRILTELTRPPGSRPGSWPAEPDAPGPRPGRFCFVGDDQQSIFARRSSVAVYRRYIEAFANGQGGERLEFDVTMRCPRRVIGLVNAIFHGRIVQRHVEFRALRERPECADGAVWRLPIRPPAEGKTEAIFREECRQVAAFLKQREPRDLRAGNWGEVAILCPRRKWLTDAAAAFADAGLPCRVVSQERLQLEEPARSWPAALLYVLLNPWDRFELIGLMRELFAVSDVELADAQDAHRPWTFWSEGRMAPRLDAALRLLRELHEAAPPRSGLSLAEYVGRVLDAACVEARLEAAGQPWEAVERLRREALDAEMAGRGLREWVARLVRDLWKPAAEVEQVEGQMPLMTCHKAKGLEWPVVIPLGLGRAIMGGSPNYPWVEEDDANVRVHVSKLTVLPDAREEQRLAQREEDQRLFYVTLTRARGLLILPDTHGIYGKKADDSFMGLAKWEPERWAEILQDAPAPRRARGGGGQGESKG